MAPAVATSVAFAMSQVPNEHRHTRLQAFASLPIFQFTGFWYPLCFGCRYSGARGPSAEFGFRRDHTMSTDPFSLLRDQQAIEPHGGLQE